MSKFILVETLSQYRMRYVVEVPDNHNEGDFRCTAIQWAEDTVTCDEMKEFSQKWIGETILDSREVNREEIIKICDLDNDYLKSWTDEQKMSLVTPVDYKKD
jgi:hypothetical protein